MFKRRMNSINLYIVTIKFNWINKYILFQQMDSLKQNLKSLIGINMEERKEAEIEIIRLRD